MEGYPMSAVERAMKVQAVILKAISGQWQWWQAAEILGVSCRTMRRWKQRYEQRGYDGLFDRRRRRPSPRKVPLATVQQVLRLYRDQYQGFNVAHFCDQLREHHDIKLSYEWVKTALQTSGAVAPRTKRGRHHQRRERRPLPGMMLYVDGSTHAWIPGLAPAQFDLVAVIDDATTEWERVSGSFSRTIELPSTVDAKKIAAHFNLGILQIRSPKTEVAKPKQIAVKVS